MTRNVFFRLSLVIFGLVLVSLAGSADDDGSRLDSEYLFQLSQFWQTERSNLSWEFDVVSDAQINELDLISMIKMWHGAGAEPTHKRRKDQ